MKQGLLLLFLFPLLLSAQDQTTDSLKLVLKNAKHDTTRCAILNILIESESDDAIWPLYNAELRTIVEKNLTIGSLTPFLKKKYSKWHADVFNNTGYLLNRKGNIPQALEYFDKSLKISEEILDKSGIAYCYNNIAGIYQDQGEMRKALEYLEKSLKIRMEIGDKVWIAESYNNLGHYYQDLGEGTKALEYYSKSLELQKQTGDKQRLATAHNNMGTIYYQQSNFSAALDNFGRSLKLQEEIGDRAGNAFSYVNMGKTYWKQKKYKEALECSKKSLQISRELGFPESIRNAAKTLTNIYKSTGDYKNALEYYEVFVIMRDSIINNETKKASVKNQLKYEYEKRAAADSVKNAEEQKVKDAQLAAQNASLKQEKFQRYSLVVGLSLVVLGLLFVVNRFRITQKQKKIIEEQKVKVDEAFDKLNEKNKEVMDSIYYAERIQRAL
ncbi:MAG: tetratricopeptide repeat protein, partial [Bacteroidia bacterium]|nr:tetratricopeptide repeat protein [Bacteroidia bacterium]